MEGLQDLTSGDALPLISDPPVEDEPRVWVHRSSGEPLGHLPPEVNQWLAPWLLRGGKAVATVLRVSGPHVPSWRRLLLQVECIQPESSPYGLERGHTQ